MPARGEGRYRPDQHQPFFQCPGGQDRLPHHPGMPFFFTTIVSIKAFAATIIPPCNGKAAFAGVTAANHSAPTSIPHVAITTRIVLLPSMGSAARARGLAHVNKNIRRHDRTLKWMYLPLSSTAFFQKSSERLR